ncbi:hypothetical protein MTO96_046268 [Rhipicephalus appendiculatus]
MSRLLAVRPVQNLHDTERLGTLYDELQSGVRSLKVLGVAASTYGVLLLTVLRKSIPHELCLEYYRRETTSEAVPEDGLKEFLNFLKVEIESRERAQRAVRPVPDAAMKQKAPITRDRHQTPSASALTVTGGQEHCTFCDEEGHTTASCLTPIPIDKKRAVMSKERRCYKCAKRNHRAAECRTSRWLKCAKCSGRHATGVCELNQTAAPPPSSDGTAPADVAVQSSLQVERTRGKATVLLQTARAFAVGENKRALVRMLLDGGSQRTFIREEVSHRLKLHVIGEERLTIYAFGSQRTLEERSYRRVECWLRNWRDNTRVRIEALEMPEIRGDLLPPPDDCIANIAQEQGLELADVVPDGYHPGFGVELLVGADHC